MAEDKANKSVHDFTYLLFEAALLTSSFVLDELTSFAKRTYRMIPLGLDVNEDKIIPDLPPAMTRHRCWRPQLSVQWRCEYTDSLPTRQWIWLSREQSARDVRTYCCICTVTTHVQIFTELLHQMTEHYTKDRLTNRGGTTARLRRRTSLQVELSCRVSQVRSRKHTGQEVEPQKA